MFKKLLVATAVLAASSSVAFAASSRHHKCDYKGELPCAPAPCATACAPAPCATACAPAPCYSPCNFLPTTYIGFGAGVRNNYSKVPVTFKGLDFNLSLGYGGIVAQNFYLAGEAFILDTVNLSNYRNNGLGVKTSWGYGLSVLPGFLIANNAFVFARLGAIESRFSDQRVYKLGGQAGIGGEIKLCGNWDLRGEYDYTWYGKVSGLGRAVQSDVFNFGLVYRI